MTPDTEGTGWWAELHAFGVTALVVVCALAYVARDCLLPPPKAPHSAEETPDGSLP